MPGSKGLTSRAGVAAPLAAALALPRLIAEWRTFYRSRQALARLDPHLLQDVGLSAEAARAESEKPFWQG